IALVALAMIAAIVVLTVSLFLFRLGGLVVAIRLPMAYRAGIATAALIPTVRLPAIAFALRDGASANPHVALAAPAPVSRRPDVAWLHGRHDFILRRRWCEVDVNAALREGSRCERGAGRQQQRQQRISYCVGAFHRHVL